MGLREGLSQDVECVSRTSINSLLEPGSANNLNESMYAYSNLIERSVSISCVKHGASFRRLLHFVGNDSLG